MEERRKELLLKNQAAWDGEIIDPKVLDSSLKKNSAFVKKLKTSINKDSASSILKEINSLSLKKYESELILGTQEGLSKCTKSQDIPAAVEITSALHQRFGESFTSGVLEFLLQSFENPPASSNLTEKDEKDRITKVKLMLRIFIEFNYVGLIGPLESLQSVPIFITQRTKNGDSLTIAVLKEVLGYKIRTGITLSIATTFVKRFPDLLESDDFVGNILGTFSENVINRTKTIHDKLNDLAQKKFKAQIRTGRILEELETEFNQVTELFEIFRAASEVLAPAFGLKLPEFKEEVDNLKTSETDSVIVIKENIWTNDDEKRFYTVFPEIPKSLVEDAALGEKDASKAQDMNDFLVKLETANTSKEVDEAAIEFWTLKLTNKASKNRLLKHFTLSKDVGRSKIYARFLKINEPYLDDIKDEVLQYLDQGFRSQIYHNGLNFRNILFFSEMIKFELIPEHIVFHKIRSLILNLTTPNNIEILSIFFEISGKYLLHEHNKLMEEMLILLDQKKKNDKLTINNKMAISNLFLVLKPPSVKSLQNKKAVLKPEQAFLKHLIRNELALNNFDDIRKIILEADFKDPDVLKTICSLFIKPEKINYENIVPLSHILKNLGGNFKIFVVDTIIENIIRDMEFNDYRHNRRRVAQCKYISEMHKRKIIGMSVIFDLIYKILTFGHPRNSPSWTNISELDPPDNYFRIQLVTVLLKGLTPSNNYKNGNKLRTVLKFFDYYIYLKDQPLPKDTEFKVTLTYESFAFKRTTSLKDAFDSLNEDVKLLNSQANSLEDEEDDDDDGGKDDEDEDDEDNDDEDDEYDDDDDNDEEEGDVDDHLQSLENLKITEETKATAYNEEVTKLSYEAYERKLMEDEEAKIEDELEKEFNRMVFESMHSQKNKQTTIEFPQNLQVDKAKDILSSNSVSNGKIPFTLVTKGSKGIMAKKLSLPSDLGFARNVVEEEIRRKEQKSQINKYILQAKYNDD